MIYFYHVTRAKASKQRRGGRTWPSSATLHRQMTAWGRRCKANHGRHTASAKGKTVSEEGNGVRGGKRCQRRETVSGCCYLGGGSTLPRASSVARSRSAVSSSVKSRIFFWRADWGMARN